jgi:hypothetical protein
MMFIFHARFYDVDQLWLIRGNGRMSEHRITIRAVLEGEEGVKDGFKRMSGASSEMSKEIKSLGKEIAALGYSAVAVGKLGESFGLLSKEQAGVIMQMGSMMVLSGHVVTALGYLAKSSNLVTLAEYARGIAHTFAQAATSGLEAIANALHAIAASSWAVAIAENARAVATAIANAVATWGLAVPIMIAAAAAAAVGIAAYTGMIKIPGFAEGGIVYKPTYALIGEREPEAIVPLSKMLASTAYISTTNNITIENPVFRGRGDMDYLVDRLKRMGKA